MYTVTNISGQVVGLYNKDGTQTNVFPGKSVRVEQITGQIKNLGDPYRKTLKVKKGE